MIWTALLLAVYVVLLLVAIGLLVDNHKRLTRLEKALRDRNEAIANALATTRPHARAFSDDKPAAKSRLSVARINW